MLRLLFRSLSLVFQCQFNLNAQLKTEYILPIKTENLMEQYLDLRETNQQFSRQRELIAFFQLLYCNRWLSRWTMWNRATERLERQACNCWNPSISSQSVWGKVNEYCVSSPNNFMRSTSRQKSRSFLHILCLAYICVGILPLQLRSVVQCRSD